MFWLLLFVANSKTKTTAPLANCNIDNATIQLVPYAYWHDAFNQLIHLRHYLPVPVEVWSDVISVSQRWATFFTKPTRPTSLQTEPNPSYQHTHPLNPSTWQPSELTLVRCGTMRDIQFLIISGLELLHTFDDFWILITTNNKWNIFNLVGLVEFCFISLMFLVQNATTCK